MMQDVSMLKEKHDNEDHELTLFTNDVNSLAQLATVKDSVSCRVCDMSVTGRF